jgi:hypothetical protein
MERAVCSRRMTVSALADGAGARPKPAQLGEILIERGLINAEQLEVALADQQVSGNLLGAILIERGFVAATTVAAALATQYGGLLKTEYGYATGFAPAPEPVEPAASDAVRFSHQLVAAPEPPDAAPAPALPPEDVRVAELTRERDELRTEIAAASVEIGRLEDESARLSAQFAADREVWGSEFNRLSTENRTMGERLAELTAERDAAGAAPDALTDRLIARVAELEVLLARGTNRSATISERLDEVIGDVARLHERLDGEETALRTRPTAVGSTPDAA